VSSQGSIYHIVSDPEMRMAVISAVLTEVATKQDIRDLRQEMNQLRQEMNQLRAEMDARFSEVRREIDDLRREMRSLIGGPLLQYSSSGDLQYFQ
jgi:uncharacterized protein involved in exopolysaccharide biosynthesis